MFGHQDDQPQQNDDNAVIPDEAINGAMEAGGIVEPDQSAAADTEVPAFDPSQQADPTPPPAPDPAPPANDTWQHPGLPLNENGPIDSGPEQISDFVGNPPGSLPKPNYATHHASQSDNSDNSDGNLPHELIEIKQKALGQLAPLIDELEQSPEDKFRTTMMMIQASDDQNLVKLAYDAANAIEDEKAKAQALLDIVNEINYFTQHPEN